MESNYRVKKRMMIDALNKCIKLHEAQHYSELDAVYQTLDTSLPRGGGPETLPIGTALNFLDGWVDDKNHSWRMYRGIAKDDWPKLARGLIKDLNAGEGISSVLVLEHFNLRHSRSIVFTIIEMLFGIGVFLIFGPFILYHRLVDFVRGLFRKQK
jgi:hypothetical protein